MDLLPRCAYGVRAASTGGRCSLVAGTRQLMIRLPENQKDCVHRAFMIASWFVAVCAFIIIFVANRNQDPPGLINTDDDKEVAHLVIGVIIMALQFANPIISIFRCKPTGKYRWIFNLVHGTMIGLGAELLALANVALGSYIFSNKWSVFEDNTIFYVFLGFLVFFLVMVGSLFLLYTILGFCRFEDVPPATRVPSVLKPLANCISEDSDNPEIEMATPPGKGDVPVKEEKPERKPASKDAVFRWIGLVVFLGVMLPMMITMIILIALEEDD